MKQVYSFSLPIVFLIVLITTVTASAMGVEVAFQATNDHQVKGVVTDETGSTLPGVNISIKGTTRGTTSNAEGAYQLTAPSQADTLIFSFVGYQTQQIPIQGRSEINVTMSPEAVIGEEVVVVGYGTRNVEDVSGAVGVINTEKTFSETNSDVLRSAQGKIPGVNITTDGRPGGNATINIRGMGSVQNNSPLYVVDGVPTSSIDGLNPRDIESMQVLKDAASASIYGARASNGVVLITTKSAQEDGITVNFNAYGTHEWKRNKLDMLNAREYGEVLWQTYENDGITPDDPIYGSGSEPTIPEYLDDDNTIPSADTDWQEETFRPSWNQNYNLSIGGKTDQSNVYFGMNYANESGMVVYTDYERFSVRLNSSFEISDRIEIGENLSLTNTTFTGGSNMPSGSWQQHAIIPVYDEEGNFGGSVKNLGDRLNPVGEMYRQKDNTSKNWGIFGDAYIDIEIIDNLNFNTTFGLDYNTTRNKSFSPTFTEGITTQSIASLFEAENRSTNSVITSTLNYVWEYGDHSFDALAGGEYVYNEFRSLSASARDYFIEDPSYRYLSSGADILGIGGDGAINTLLSQFGRVDYNYDNTYYASATIRRDGSSRFGPENRWAIFPSFSASWRVSNEAFMEDVPFVSDLRLRSSWGQNGNQEIGNYSFADFYYSQPSYSNVDIEGNNSGSIAQGFIVDQIGNPEIKWETSEQINVGVDVGLFDDRLQVVADYFIKKSKDLLVNPQLLAVQGEGLPPFINAGDIENRGLEFQVSYSNAVRDFGYDIDFNVGIVRNEVLSVGENGDGEIIGGYQGSVRIKPGQPIGSFYGYEMDGVFQSQQEVDEHADQPGKGLGRMKFRDLNDDGVINDEDRTFIGNPHPDFTFGIGMGFDWKRLDFSMFWDGSVGNDIWNMNTFNYKTMYFSTNKGKELLDAWSPDNPDSDIPAVTFSNTNDELRPSTFFIEKGSFLRLKNLQLGYTLPEKYFPVGNARVYVQAQNIFDITTFSGLDYEVQTNGPLDIGVHNEDTYQHTRSVSLGIDVQF